MQSDEDVYKRARARVAELRGFYTHAAVFIVVNVFLVVLNFLTSPHQLWFYWVLFGWGIGLAVHALYTLGSRWAFGREWEERKIRELVERERTRPAK